MDIFVWLLVVGVVMYLLKRFRLGEARHSAKGVQEADWKSDDATQKQLDYIESLSGNRPAGLTKGQASTLIDQLLPPDPSDLQVLRFFKVSTKGLGQKAASDAAQGLLSDSEKLERWRARPPSQEQREFFRFFGFSVPAGIGQDEAAALRTRHIKELKQSESAKLNDWKHYSELLEELADPEYREGFDIKKPSLSLVRKVVADLIAEGWTYERLRDDEDEFIDRLIAADPRIEKQ